MSDGRYWLQTLGCPKNQVDSDKLAGLLGAEGYRPAGDPGDADLVVVNTCAFIEAARQESVDTVLALADVRRPGARLVVTGCMAERYGSELAEALPEVDLVAGFGVPLTGPSPAGPPPPAVALSPAGPPPTPVTLGGRRRHTPAPDSTPVGADGTADSTPVGADGTAGAARAASSFDLLALPRPPARAPWAYVKVAEGCDRRCGFCAIPSFRGPQRSRPVADVLAEVRSLVAGAEGGAGVSEIVLVAQDLASFGRDRSGGPSPTRAPARHGDGPADAVEAVAPIVSLTKAVSALVPRTRLLYLYPSQLTDALVQAVLATGVPYFDLSLQHVSRPHLARMRRWGEGERFLRRIEEIRALEPAATFRSSFILGYPGETEEDHDQLLDFLRRARLDWAGFFTFSAEQGTYAVELPDRCPSTWPSSGCGSAPSCRTPSRPSGVTCWSAAG